MQTFVVAGRTVFHSTFERDVEIQCEYVSVKPQTYVIAFTSPNFQGAAVFLFSSQTPILPTIRSYYVVKHSYVLYLIAEQSNAEIYAPPGLYFDLSLINIDISKPFTLPNPNFYFAHTGAICAYDIGKPIGIATINEQVYPIQAG